MKQIKIIGSCRPIYWYSSHIGEVFDIEREHDDVFWVREKGLYRCLNFVLKSDCEVINNQDNQGN